MSPASTAPAAIESLSLELEDVEWFGRSALEQVPARTAPLDLLLVVAGAITGAALYLLPLS